MSDQTSTENEGDHHVFTSLLSWFIDVRKLEKEREVKRIPEKIHIRALVFRYSIHQ